MVKQKICIKKNNTFTIIMNFVQEQLKKSSQQLRHNKWEENSKFHAIFDTKIWHISRENNWSHETKTT